MQTVLKNIIYSARPDHTYARDIVILLRQKNRALLPNSDLLMRILKKPQSKSVKLLQQYEASKNKNKMKLI